MYPPHDQPATTDRVLDLGPADVADELVTPGGAEPDGAAVVEHPDAEAHVDVGLDFGRPAVEVDRRRAAVDQQERGPRLRALRLDDPAVDALALRVRELPGHERPAGRGALGRLEDRRVVADLEDEARVLAPLEAVPDAAIRSDAGAGEA